MSFVMRYHVPSFSLLLSSTPYLFLLVGPHCRDCGGSRKRLYSNKGKYQIYDPFSSFLCWWRRVRWGAKSSLIFSQRLVSLLVSLGDDTIPTWTCLYFLKRQLTLVSLLFRLYRLHLRLACPCRFWTQPSLQLSPVNPILEQTVALAIYEWSN